MKISLQMIQNRLTQFDTDSFISQADMDSQEPRYRSVRLFRASECLFLQQTGEDVTLWGENDNSYIVIKNIDPSTAFFLVQDVFDYYNAWYDRLMSNIRKRDFQAVIDDATAILDNPVFFGDVNCKIIALSKKYGRDTVNPEWTHMCDNGYVSVTNYVFMKRHAARINTEKDIRVHYFRPGMKKTQKYGFITACVRIDNDVYGRITVMEYEHKITAADCAILETLCTTISAYFRPNRLSTEKMPDHDTIIKLMSGHIVEPSSFNSFLRYKGWRKKGEYLLCQIRFQEKLAPNYLDTLAEYCENHGDFLVSFKFNDSIFILLNEPARQAYEDLQKVRAGINEIDSVAAVSIPFSDLEKIVYYLKQTDYVLEQSDAHKRGALVLFEWFAVDYILESSLMAEKYYAISYDIRILAQIDKDQGTAYIETLQCYLQNERSITLTAANLFIHKNTLVYRIKKITELLGCDLNDSDLRRYYILSLELLKLSRKTELQNL